MGSSNPRRRYESVLCPLLTIPEAAERIGCEPALLWALLHREALPGVVRLGRYFVEENRLAEVEEVLTRPEDPNLSPPLPSSGLSV